ncbi:hypothetical protein CSIV_14375 [Microbacterium sp. CSI-V]|uniref:hypothetical protein n=1 Tax=Microbacterium sp. CSI-V TaxID=1933777 RepID=UPI00097BD9E6|nr:hypothetical protein [Microbacterium sp. CSI-V]ONI62657.1 hypothetical protein CSIV_14375 [Microbacterium sp. CSI-V]
MTDIQLPTDDKPSRIHRPTAAPVPLPVDDVAQTLAEYTRYALSTGARLEIEPVEFTADGEVWVPLWLHDGPPAAARATVRRDGIPTVVFRRWVEALPGETVLTNDGRLWRDIWEANPTERLESYVLRAALGRAFADVIGDRPEPGKPRAASERGEEGWYPAPPPPAEIEQLADGLLARLGVGPVVHLEPGALEAAVMSAPRRPSAVVPRPPAPDVPHLEKPRGRRAESRAQRDRRGGEQR